MFASLPRTHTYIYIIVWVYVPYKYLQLWPICPKYDRHTFQIKNKITGYFKNFAEKSVPFVSTTCHCLSLNKFSFFFSKVILIFFCPKEKLRMNNIFVKHFYTIKIQTHSCRDIFVSEIPVILSRNCIFSSIKFLNITINGLKYRCIFIIMHLKLIYYHTDISISIKIFRGGGV